jgi:membrane protein YqaA with SNARE-associated domain
MPEFAENALFSYNQRRKAVYGILLVLGVVVGLSLVAYYFLFLRQADFAAIRFLNTIGGHVKFHVANSTMLGIFYTAAVGGLFFVSIPLEVLFFRYLSAHPPILVFFLFHVGIVLAFTVNYQIGARLSEASKKLISPKRFYRIKGMINRHGVLAVYLLNVMPFTSQPLSALLGVFRYNKVRFYIFMLLGQLTKFGAIFALFMLSGKFNIQLLAGGSQ